MSSTPCVNVTILDDNIPKNILYITIGLSVDSNDFNAVFIVPERNETTIAILDDDHGMCNKTYYITSVNYACWFCSMHILIMQSTSLCTGISVGFNDPFIEVTEGVNFSTNICGFINSLTGIWKRNLSALLVTVNSTTDNGVCTFSVPKYLINN